MDTRSQNLIEIVNPNKAARRMVAGVLQGSRDARINKRVLRVAEIASSAMFKAWEIRGNRNFGVGEITARTREAFAPLIKSIDTEVKGYAADRNDVLTQARTLWPVKRYEDNSLPHYVPTLDLRMLDWFDAQPLGKRAAIQHALGEEPMAHLRLAESFLRLPRELVNVDEGTFGSMRVGLLKVFKRAEFDMLEEEMTQATVADKLMSDAAEAFRFTTGTTAELREFGPELLGFTQGPLAPLRWREPVAESAGPVIISARSAPGAQDGGAQDA